MKPEAPLQWHDPKHVTKSLQRVYRILRRNVSYGSLKPGDDNQNMDGYPASAQTPGVANTEFAVNHGLNRVPVGFHVMNKDGATDVYKSTTPWNKQQVFLKATGIGINLSLFIF